MTKHEIWVVQYQSWDISERLNDCHHWCYIMHSQGWRSAKWWVNSFSGHGVRQDWDHDSSMKYMLYIWWHREGKRAGGGEEDIGNVSCTAVEGWHTAKQNMQTCHSELRPQNIQSSSLLVTLSSLNWLCAGVGGRVRVQYNNIKT